MQTFRDSSYIAREKMISYNQSDNVAWEWKSVRSNRNFYGISK